MLETAIKIFHDFAMLFVFDNWDTNEDSIDAFDREQFKLRVLLILCSGDKVFEID